MNKPLDYSSKTMEQFAINTISKSFDSSYALLKWNDKGHDFDFTSESGSLALEIATIIPKNEREAIKYEDALRKGRRPNPKKVINATIDSTGELLIYYGGSMSEIRKKIIEMIETKESKRAKYTIKKYARYELCLCISDGAIFDSTRDFEFITKNDVLKSTGFSRLFLITSSHFFVIEDNCIKEYKRLIS